MICLYGVEEGAFVLSLLDWRHTFFSRIKAALFSRMATSAYSRAFLSISLNRHLISSFTESLLMRRCSAIYRFCHLKLPAESFDQPFLPSQQVFKFPKQKLAGIAQNRNLYLETNLSVSVVRAYNKSAISKTTFLKALDKLCVMQLQLQWKNLHNIFCNRLRVINSDELNILSGLAVC